MMNVEASQENQVVDLSALVFPTMTASSSSVLDFGSILAQSRTETPEVKLASDSDSEAADTSASNLQAGPRENPAWRPWDEGQSSVKAEEHAATKSTSDTSNKPETPTEVQKAPEQETNAAPVKEAETSETAEASTVDKTSGNTDTEKGDGASTEVKTETSTAGTTEASDKLIETLDATAKTDVETTDDKVSTETDIKVEVAAVETDSKIDPTLNAKSDTVAKATQTVNADAAKSETTTTVADGLNEDLVADNKLTTLNSDKKSNVNETLETAEEVVTTDDAPELEVSSEKEEVTVAKVEKATVNVENNSELKADSTVAAENEVASADTKSQADTNAGEQKKDANVKQVEFAQVDEVVDADNDVEVDALTQNRMTDLKVANLTTLNAGNGSEATAKSGAEIADNNTQKVDGIAAGDKSDATSKQVAAKRMAQTVDQTAMIDRITRNMKLMVSRNQSSLSMRLDPPELGKMHIRLVMRSGNALHASVKVDSQVAQEALNTNLEQLKESLQESGIKVESFSISVNDRESQENPFAQQGNKGQGRNQARQEAREDNNETRQDQSHQTGNDRLNLIA